jgi:reverse transcriptase-like protein
LAGSPAATQKLQALLLNQENIMSNNESSRRRFLQAAAVGVGAGLPTWPMIAQGAQIATPLEPGQSLGGRGTRDVPCESLRVEDHSEVISAIEQSIAFIIAEGVDAHFARPFELQRLAHQADLRKEVVSLCLGYMTKPQTIEEVAPLLVMLVPKNSMSGYRRCAHAELVSAVLYLTCAILIARRIEPSRSSVSAEREFSFRFKPQGSTIFDPACDYQAFRNRVLAKLDPQTPSVIVNADIGNFFASISTERLVEILHQYGVEPWITKPLHNILSQWRSQWPAGIPIGPAASSVLAEAALLNVDRRLESENIDFVRYVDDYVLFAPNMPAARRCLESLVGSLADEGLNLNGAKTSIDSVTRSAYEKHLNARRSGRFWGGLGLTNGRDNLPDGTSTNQPEGRIAQVNPQKKKKTTPRPPAYLESPFKKSQLSDFDTALLEQVDPADALSRLQMQVVEERLVSLGQFRVFTEAACYHDDYALLSEVFGILDHCHHCIPYVVDVLIAARDELPAEIRTTARQWFVDRLNSNNAMSSFQLISVAALLGTEGYQHPEAVFAYLQSSAGEVSPVVTRAFLNALSGHCNPERAKILAKLGSRSDAFARRALFDLAWMHLDGVQRAALIETHRSDFERDPFLHELSNMTEV